MLRQSRGWGGEGKRREHRWRLWKEGGDYHFCKHAHFCGGQREGRDRVGMVSKSGFDRLIADWGEKAEKGFLAWPSVCFVRLCMLCDGGRVCIPSTPLTVLSPYCHPPPTQDKVLALVSVTYHVWIISILILILWLILRHHNIFTGLVASHFSTFSLGFYFNLICFPLLSFEPYDSLLQSFRFYL